MSISMAKSSHCAEGTFDLTGVPLTIDIAKLYHRVRFRPGR